MSEGDAERAARLLGAAESARLSIPAPLPWPFAAWHEACEAAARQALGGPAFSTAERHGAGLGFERAVAEALGEATVPAREPFRGAPPAVALTAREAEVAGLVAEGLSDREIAARLVVSPRTAETRVQHILRKLGFRSRAQIAGWVAGAAPNRPDVGQAS
jgi:DNA-binding NarL/FixJ family response regulator